jgi:hypothetical protein
MKKITRKNTVAMLCIMAISLSSNPLITFAKEVSKATVDTQKELEAALSNDNVTSITIKTSKNVTFTVPKTSYATKSVYIKAPNATIKNCGKFKAVNVYVTTQAQLEKVLVNSTIKYTYLTISTTDSAKFKISGDHAKVGLIINAPNAIVENNSNFKSVNVHVSTQEQLEKVLQDSKVTTITISTKEAVELTIPEGKYQNVNLVVNAPEATVINHGEFKDTTVTDGKVTVPEVTPTEPTTPEQPTTDNGSNGGGSTGGGTNGGGYSPVVTSPEQPTVPVTPAVPEQPTEPVVPTVPTNPQQPTEPVTPQPTEPTQPTEPSIPVQPQPTEPTQPTEPSNPVQPNITNLRTEYSQAIITEAATLKNFMTVNEWDDFSKLVDEYLHYIKIVTTSAELTYRYEIAMDTIYERQRTNQRFLTSTPYFTDILSPEQLINNYSGSITNGMYDFTIVSDTFGIERHYYVPASDAQLVNNITFTSATQTVASGSAITYEIGGWNNINGEEGVVGIYVLQDSTTPGQYNIGAELERNVDYHILSDSIIIEGNVTEGLSEGHYGLFIKTEIPYLNIYTGNYNYFNIID